MTLPILFAGFQSCTSGELTKARAVQIVLNGVAFFVIYQVIKELTKVKNRLAQYLLIGILSLLAYVGFAILFFIITVYMIGLCTGSPALWQF